MNSYNVTDLPFVSADAENGRHSFWSTEPAADQLTAARLGREYALAYLEFEAGNRAGSVLGLVFHDMMRAGDNSLIARHFLYTIASALETALSNPWFVEALRRRHDASLPDWPKHPSK